MYPLARQVDHGLGSSDLTHHLDLALHCTLVRITKAEFGHRIRRSAYDGKCCEATRPVSTFREFPVLASGPFDSRPCAPLTGGWRAKIRCVALPGILAQIAEEAAGGVMG